MGNDDPISEYPSGDSRTGAYHVARTAVDAAVSVVPGAGYAVGHIIEALVSAPLQKRRDAWFTKVGIGLRDMQERLDGFDPRHLGENEDFVSAVAEATQAALKTAKTEKIEALRNGVLNIANGMDIDEVLRGTFFALIERFSPAHVDVLKLLADPSSSPEMKEAADRMMMGPQLEVLRAAVPRSKMSEPALQRVLADLHRDGLADTGGMMAMGTSGVFLAKRSSGVGDAFLRFIADPTLST